MRSRSLLLVAPRRVCWVEEDLPAPGVDEVLVETQAGAISIGAELPQYLGIARSSSPSTYPRMTGYESVGRVVACGRGVRRLEVGQRVAAFYGHRAHAIVPEPKAIRVPDDNSQGLALLVILSCDAAKGVRKLLGAAPDAAVLEGPVLVTGAGTIGLLTIFVLEAMGTRAVDVAEPRPERRELALELGARRALTPAEMRESDTARYLMGFECSSRNAAFELLQASLEHGGRVGALSDGNVEPLVLAPAFHEKELSVVGSSDGWDYQQHAEWYFGLVRGKWAKLERIFDYRTSAADLPVTFERLARGEIAPTKVLVEYGG